MVFSLQLKKSNSVPVKKIKGKEAAFFYTVY